MSASQSRLADNGSRLPMAESSSSEDLEAQEIEISHSMNHSLLLQDTNYTKDTVAASQPIPGGENEKRRQGDGEKPRHVGFWHAELNNVRLHVLKLWARTVLILMTFVLLALSLFNGVYFHIPKNYPSLIVYVVDFDGQVPPYQGGLSIVGPAIVQATESMAKSDTPHLGFITMAPSMFNNDPIAVRRAVYDFKAHAAIIINANASALLQQAAEQGNATYDPKGAAQIIYVSARDQNTIPTYVVPELTALEMAVTSQFGASWTKSLMQNSTITRANLAAVPQALSPAIGFTTFDLRPFGPANVTPAVSIGLIYLIIIAFFSFTFFLPIHLKFLSPRGHPPLHFHQLIIWRWVATTAAYFFLSLGYSFIALAFQVPFSNGPASPTEPAINPSAYGRGTFLVYWMINFLGMSALGLACENVAMVLGNPASHQVLFDLHSRIGLNIGILVVWFVVNSILFAPACYLMRWAQQQAGKKAAQKEKEWMSAMSRQRSKLGILKKDG
ncbi:MAG: hypothetical protein Q9175_007494 [Cornicularia normoerica]